MPRDLCWSSTVNVKCAIWKRIFLTDIYIVLHIREWIINQAWELYYLYESEMYLGSLSKLYSRLISLNFFMLVIVYNTFENFSKILSVKKKKKCCLLRGYNPLSKSKHLQTIMLIISCAFVFNLTCCNMLMFVQMKRWRIKNVWSWSSYVFKKYYFINKKQQRFFIRYIVNVYKSWWSI